MKRLVIVVLTFVAGCGGTVGMDCEPECTGGYVCRGGACVEPCDPPCPDGYVCNLTSLLCNPIHDTTTDGDVLMDPSPDTDAGDVPGEDLQIEDVEIECDSFHLPCEGECIDPMADRSNCGECGNICPMEALCVWGECDCQPAGTTLCGGECVEFGTNENCAGCGDGCDVAIGEACRGGTCACEEGWGICEGACVNLQIHDRHCGDCDTPCANFWGCVGGTCECLVDSCSRDGHVFCTDLMTNDSFCGTCSNDCSFDEVCSGGHCQASCSAPYSQCTDGFGNTGCYDLLNGPVFCGTCWTYCGDVERCDGGTCVPK